jgi:hypothetical protein
MFEWTIEYLADEYTLYLKSRGIMDSSSANVMVKALVDTAVEYKCLTHLVDHRETTFALGFLEYFDRPAINQRLGVSRSFKTAMVFAQLTRDTMFMETVFRNRGYNLRHFTDIDEARVWLMQK